MLSEVVLALFVAQAGSASSPARQTVPAERHVGTASRALVRTQGVSRDASPPARRATARLAPEPAPHQQMRSLEYQARVNMILYPGRFDRSEVALTQPAATRLKRGQ